MEIFEETVQLTDVQLLLKTYVQSCFRIRIDHSSRAGIFPSILSYVLMAKATKAREIEGKTKAKTQTKGIVTIHLLQFRAGAARGG